MLNVKHTLTGILLLTSLWHGFTQAQEVKMYSDRAPSAEEMANILFSKPAKMGLAAKSGGIKTRSISFGKPKLPEPPALAQTETKNAVGLPIKFGYNSAEILSESLPFLNEVGKMLSIAEYSQEKLVVEGHTDAYGSENYNQFLSEKRANSVKTYLMKNFNIAANRLYVYGKGENQPLDGINPFASVNRRVQFYSAP